MRLKPIVQSVDNLLAIARRSQRKNPTNFERDFIEEIPGLLSFSVVTHSASVFSEFIFEELHGLGNLSTQCWVLPGNNQAEPGGEVE